MNWFIKRTGQALFTLYAVVTLTFVVVSLMPGSAASVLRTTLRRQNPDMSAEEINVLVQHYITIDPNKPVHIAYIEYVTGLLQGDLGHSLRFDEPVADILVSGIPWTVLVMSLSTFFMFGIALSLGALMAYYEGSNLDLGMTGVGILLNSIPYYVAAVLFIVFFGPPMLDVLPARGRYPRGVEPGASLDFLFGVIEHAILPTASFVITGFGILALAMRGNSIQVLGEDYVRVARLRGLADRRIALRYVGRNAILPMYTSLLISIGFLFGGSIITEQIFQYHGVGYYMLQAIEYRDTPLMMGVFLIITISVVIAVWFADATYGKIDPRIQTGDEGEAY